MDFQKLLDTMSEADRRTRGNYHITLGDLIKLLENAEETMPVRFANSEYGPGNPHSYRGYYSDLAFEDISDVTVKHVLADCRESFEKTFTGYKGGDFFMGADTPLWNSPYGCCGKAIVGASVIDGVLTLETKEID